MGTTYCSVLMLDSIWSGIEHFLLARPPRAKRVPAREVESFIFEYDPERGNSRKTDKSKLAPGGSCSCESVEEQALAIYLYAANDLLEPSPRSWRRGARHV